MEETDNLAAKIRDLLYYDKDSGAFFRNKKTNRRVSIGARADMAGGRRYLRVTFGGTRMYAHRAAWLYTYGELPPFPLQVDHINGDRFDNRISNLRAVTPSVNTQNERVARGGNSSGLLGVHWNSRMAKWRTSIRVEGGRISLGLFDDKHAAYAAYLEAKRRLHPGCTI